MIRSQKSDAIHHLHKSPQKRQRGTGVNELSYAVRKAELDRLTYWSMMAISIATPFTVSVLKQTAQHSLGDRTNEIAGAAIITGFLLSNFSFLIFLANRPHISTHDVWSPTILPIFVRFSTGILILSLAFLIPGVVVFLYASGLHSISLPSALPLAVLPILVLRL